MNDDLHQRQTGRTARMLKHAREIQKTGKQVIVMGVNNPHARQMFNDLGDGSNEEGLPKILVVTFREAICGNWYHPGTGWTHYDYATNTFRKAGNMVCLVDHAALQHHLTNVIGYLKVTEPISDTRQWLLDTARVTAWMGRRVYFVSDDDYLMKVAKEELAPYNVSVERPEMLRNLDLLSLTIGRAHPNCQLLLDPAMMRRMFRGAINEINRWDEK
jgi:hypothetical protein